ncbi:MAG: OmpA family protein [Rickettsiales bacterium]|nr:OmpA family protein [Rickettsiales bacterium]
MKKLVLALMLAACGGREIPTSLDLPILASREIIADDFTYNHPEVPDFEYERVRAAARRAMNSSRRYVIHITGHTDDLGSDRENYILGMKRAEHVAEMFHEEGVPFERMILESKGKYQPYVPDDSPENRSHNRRVEMEILCSPKPMFEFLSKNHPIHMVEQ